MGGVKCRSVKSRFTSLKRPYYLYVYICIYHRPIVQDIEIIKSLLLYLHISWKLTLPLSAFCSAATGSMHNTLLTSVFSFDTEADCVNLWITPQVAISLKGAWGRGGDKRAQGHTIPGGNLNQEEALETAHPVRRSSCRWFTGNSHAAVTLLLLPLCSIVAGRRGNQKAVYSLDRPTKPEEHIKFVRRQFRLCHLLRESEGSVFEERSQNPLLFVFFSVCVTRLITMPTPRSAVFWPCETDSCGRCLPSGLCRPPPTALIWRTCWQPSLGGCLKKGFKESRSVWRESCKRLASNDVFLPEQLSNPQELECFSSELCSKVISMFCSF